MRKTFTTLILGAISLVVASQVHALNITAMDSAGNLTHSLLGSGISISNIQYNGANNASGYFTNGYESGIGIDSGIVLTTGSAANLNGTSNTADDTTTANYLGGNEMLNHLINNGIYSNSTYDATTLEFDFVTQNLKYNS